ncbi:hypothetical protein CPB85DRAFT_1435862 [Mucidula mucida]|nr:hypothetical protein CPB85DRAFT_1435862 [Mucidula mucida]
MSIRDDISTSSLPSPSLDPSRFGSPSISVDVSKWLPEGKSDGADTSNGKGHIKLI